MTTMALVKQANDTAIEKALIEGDLSQLSPNERKAYYLKTCESLGLNPLTKPFEYIRLNGKLVLYARKDCTDQLRAIHKISCVLRPGEIVEGVYSVKAHGETPDGREDEATGAVAIEGLKGEARANAMMKAETKAKRRLALSICGLGMTDESEVDDIRGAQTIAVDVAHEVDHETGELRQLPTGATEAQLGRFAQRSAEIAAANTVAALKRVGEAIARDLKSTAITLEQRARLYDAATHRKLELTTAPKSSAEDVIAEEPSMDTGDVDPADLGP